MIYSMTAFARCTDQDKEGTATWEIRSVNHRYLDCSFKMPETFRPLEPKLRDIVKKHLNRGRVECFLRFQTNEESTPDLSVNIPLVKQLNKAIDTVRKTASEKLNAVNPLQILSWDKVLNIHEAKTEKSQKLILKLFEQAITELTKTRAGEGKALQKILLQKLKELSPEMKKIKKALPKIIKQKRQNLLDHLQEIKTELDQTRLEQEMIFFAQKIDVAEELDRLETHINETTRILKEGGVIGKRLDFLMQELNREANTLASKSADQLTTHRAIDLKVLIEQMREQVQNIE